LIGLNPFDGSQKEYWIEKDLIQSFYKKGLLGKFKELNLVKEIALSPAVVFQGLKRDGHEESLCFAGVASHAYTRNGLQISSPPPNKTFEFFVMKNDKIYWWAWDEAENGTYPLDYRNRFTCQIWPRI